MKAGDGFVEFCCLLYVSRLAWVAGHGWAVVTVWSVGFLLNYFQMLSERNR